MVDGERGLSAEDKINIEKYAKANEGRVIVALNKIDHIPAPGWRKPPPNK